MQLLNAISTEQLERIHALYEEAFPASEKKPFEFIRQKRETGNFEIMEIVDESGEFCGLVIMMLYENLALLDYFAIASECRGTGVGSVVLKLLQERYAGRKFMLEIESTVGLESVADKDGANAENGSSKMSIQVQALPIAERKARLRRKSFYLRNNMRPMDFCVDLFGVEMEILVCGESVTYEEYYSVLKSTVPPNLIHRVRLL